MSGLFEDWWEYHLNKYVRKLSKTFKCLSPLIIEGERKLAYSHIHLTAWTTLIWVGLAYISHLTFFNYIALANYMQVVIAEWPPKGRAIDWITRTVGWCIGAVFAIIALI